MDESAILIVGANGQLGTALRERYPTAQATDSSNLDISNNQAMAAFDWSDVSVILNAAAYTNVDGAESADGRIAAWQVNATGVANLAAAAIQHDITLVHISSEYVFDGTKQAHTEEESLSPLSSYGASKAAGDVAVQLVPQHYLLRTSWVIGEGKNFVRTMIGLGQKGISPTVVADQIGRPTFTGELVRAIDHLLSTNQPYGTYNVSNGGDPVSWADLTRTIFDAGNFDLTVTDTTTAAYFADKPEAAKRPLASTLNLAKIEATGITMADWRTDLENYVNKELNS